MSRVVNQPIGQKRLTNVAVVRYKKKGKRFEVACYKNKVLNWRNGVETDIDEVLQATTVFSNVSKGTLAKHEDLMDVFGTDDEDQICRLILADGDLQVSDKERQLELDSLFKDVASVLSEKCINPDNNKPYTITMLERALKDVHFSVDLHRNAKQQALDALPVLQKKFAIKRALMRLQIQMPTSCKSQLADLLQKLQAEVEQRDFANSQACSVGAMQMLAYELTCNQLMMSMSDSLGPSAQGMHELLKFQECFARQDLSAPASPEVIVTCLVEPGYFREIHSFVQHSSDGQGRLEVVSLAAIDETDTGAAFEMSTPQPLQATPSATAGAAATNGSDGATDGSNAGLEASTASRAISNSGFAAPAAVQPQHRAQATETSGRSEQASGDVIYARGPISGIPEAHASRRDRFAELDELQPGWHVELRGRKGGTTVDATFFSPEGEKVGAYVTARRAALQASKR